MWDFFSENKLLHIPSIKEEQVMTKTKKVSGDFILKCSSSSIAIDAIDTEYNPIYNSEDFYTCVVICTAKILL